MAGENLAAGPAQEAVRQARGQHDCGRQQPVEQAEGRDGEQAEAVGELLEEHFRQQIEERVEEEHGEDERAEKAERMGLEPAVQCDDAERDDDEVGERVADEDGPEKIFRLLEVAMQDGRAGVAFAHHLADAQAAEGEHAGLHSREEKRRGEAGGHDERGEAGVVHVSRPLSCAWR